jgi:two-component system, OmpR family, copper resistance phosphate regulon response regulator CusR
MLAPKVLVVEDEPQMARFVSKGLGEEGYVVDIASNGAQALSLAAKLEPDLIVLDLQLPVKDGLTVCRELRAQSFRAPILILTALGGDTQVVAGLNAGADDYLPKPFDFSVLLARIRALLRRSRNLRSDVLQLADLVLNTVDHTVMRAGRPIRLTAKEYALLELLMLFKGQILGRAQIAEHVWDEGFDPLSNIVDVYMNRLRKKLDHGFGRQLIHTRRREGYMLSEEAPESSYV